MKGKILFAVGLGVGYGLGTRAGRRRYEQIKSVALTVWDSPAVQKPVHSVQDYAADRIGDLGGAVTENLKRAVSKSARQEAGAAAPGGTTASKGTASKGAASKGAASKGAASKRTASKGTARTAGTTGTSADGGDGTGGQAS